MSFHSDLAFGEEGEYLVLKKLHFKYPKAYKVEDANIGVTKGAQAAIEAAGGSVVVFETPTPGKLTKKERPEAAAAE